MVGDFIRALLIKVLTRSYAAFFTLLVVVWYILPDSPRDLIPALPFDIDWGRSRLTFTSAVTLLALCALATWENRTRLNRLFALTYRPRKGGAGRPRKQQPVADLIFIVSGLLIPLWFAYPLGIAADHEVANTPEDKLRDRLHAASAPVFQPEIQPSPDPQRDPIAQTRLPVMNLQIPDISQHHLTAALPRIGQAGQQFSIYSNEKFSWPYLPAFFDYGGIRYPVDIRYRGWNSDHYMGYKKSWRIKFRKNDLFFGRRQVNLINQRDHSLINDILWSELLRESGIMVPYQFLTHVRINGEYRGVQTFLEQPDRYFAERHNRNVSEVYGEESPLNGPSVFVRPELWQQYSNLAGTNDMAPLMVLNSKILDKASPQYLTTIERILDVDHYLKYLAHGAISCQENPSTHNIRWLRDPAIGRFQILPWYQGPHRFILKGYHDLWQRKGWHSFPLMIAINDVADGLLRHHVYRQRYLTHLWRLMQSTHHVDHISQKIVELQALIRPDAWADSHKHYGGDMERYISNAEWEETVVRIREMVASRYDYVLQSIQGGPVQAIDSSTGRNIQTDVITTNHAGMIFESVSAKIESAVKGDKLELVVLGPEGNRLGRYPGTFDARSATVTFTPRHVMAIRVERKAMPLGPGVIVSDLGRVNNPDLGFIGGVSKLASHYAAKSTRYRLQIHATTPVRGTITAMRIRNGITGRTLPVINAGGQPVFGGQPVAKPAYSEAVRRLVCPHPSPNARSPEETRTSIRPDGIVLRDVNPAGLINHSISGERIFRKNVTLIQNGRVLITPGSTIRFAPGTSWIVYGNILAIGTPERPIRFTGITNGAPWGSIFLNSLANLTNRFEHCIFEGNTNTTINRLPVTAALAAYTAPVTVSNCVFHSITADDAFNSKYVSPVIANCTFSNNLDAIDIDMGGGLVIGSRFVDNRDDCIDLSSSWAMIEGNFIDSRGDKGISVGEKSAPTIYNNIITKATMAIAVKDLSAAEISNNTLVSNATAIALYEKKVSFGPASAMIRRNVMHFNDQTITTDRGSRFTAEQNSATDQLSGNGNTKDVPHYGPAWQLPPDSPLRRPIHRGAIR